MSAPVLPFLYPHLFKPLLRRRPRHPLKSLPRCQDIPQKAAFSISHKHRQETYAQRYGTAQEPQIPPPTSSEPPKLPGDDSLASAIEKEVKPPELQEKKTEAQDSKAVAKQTVEGPSKQDKEDKKEETTPMEDRGKAIEATMQDPGERAKELVPDPPPEPNSPKQDAASHGLATVMAMPAPTVEKTVEEHKTPHLATPPYVHNFDTYTLVKDLERGGFQSRQSETTMKGVRALLGVNLDVAKDGLVSKSDVENETYLFRAACSELRTEILNLRKSSTQKAHSNLTHLQHTYDILSQRTTNELAALRDELKGMLNDRRMDNQSSKQSLDSSITELNYMISTAISSDAKSEIEGLRWVLTRRAAMTLGGMVVMILGGLQYGRYKTRERQAEEKRRESARGEGKEIGTQTQEAEVAVGASRRDGDGDSGGSSSRAEASALEGKEGDVGFVSLG
ncbi:uncharacterized protein KY384_003571 [Bacidia gigantensis]|uniref:uncharacterized protein n=1 Tax=Bacidia gigantensis TaxID=2732470 RepID=UPI001D04386C|nr:uncharacterized protein KY384_003571 [Bacidia gigantensis]KAG8531935.1 hypothetical protein KY384_003571 [Bacidia gigantensis]